MIFNVTGGGGGAGCTLTITAPVGATVTVSKDGKSKPSKEVATTGAVVFKGLESGIWTVTITNGTDTASKTVEIKADYETQIGFFTATIHVVYPAGLACTATDGVTTLTAPNTSGTWACVVPNKGTWTITAGEWSGEVDISATGQTETVRLAKWIVKNGRPTDIGLATQLISGRTPTVVQGDGYTQFTATKSGEANGILSNNAIDMEKVKTIIADINILTVGTSTSNAKFAGITLALTQSTKYTTLDKAGTAITHYMVGKTAGRQKLSIDAANITGDWYVGFAIGVKGDFRVYDLRVEV